MKKGSMFIDAHQHFWKYDAHEYPWINESMRVLRRDFLPEDLVREQAKAGGNGSVAVQARQSIEETRWLLELADQHPVIRGVVGWVDLRSAEVRDQLSRWAGHPKLVGVRHVVQDEPDVRFLMQTDFVRGIRQMRELDLAYDLLVYPKQLPAAIELVKELPEQRFVLDHMAKPLIRAGVLGPWPDYIRELARHSNVYCKISGLVTEAAWQGWKQEDFRMFLDVVWEAFGEDRLMVGSDWPVCLLAATYKQVMDIPRQYFAAQPELTQKKIFGTNAEKFYGLGETSP